MNFIYRMDLLWHAWMLHAGLADFEAEASMDLASFTLKISARNRYYRFHPRFTMHQGDRVGYAPRPSREMFGFAGWLPYVNKRWPIGSGKFAFKDFCAEKGLPTPRMWRRPQPDMRDFLVKHDLSSSGSGMRGPFRAYDAASDAQALPEGGYYEQFVRGGMLKAWYWESRLVGLELHPMPMVTGDGSASFRDLVTRARRRPGATADWSPYHDLAAWQGLTLDTVPPEGARLLAEFRYTSPLNGGVFDNVPSLARYRDARFVPQLERFGPILWHGIPEDVRPAALFSLDAIVDQDERLWLLEMNCNPAVHPDAYPFMLETLFGPRTSRAPAAPAPLRQPPPGAALPLQSLVMPDLRPERLPATASR